jgi:hypothetical protein
MPQIQVFQCPSCGANLSYDGGPEISFACQFCGTTVIVPKELRSDTPGFGKQSGGELPATLEGRIKKFLAGPNVSSVDDPELLELVQLELSELITEEIQTAGGARAAQLNELLRVAGSGKKPQALTLFHQAFPTLSASEAEQAVKILGSGSGA